ncbi:hypothetical protein P376_1427 [Streptomyces sp. HCCB10043]|nr:hypothetical protein P376_1427 [Streptomyces sp. HCCB10043]EWS92449.1 hypothetical protein SSIG_02963 [Streptomyces filamentosus NRRL 11379]
MRPRYDAPSYGPPPAVSPITPCDAGPPAAVGWEAEQGSGGGGGSRTWVL